MHEAAAQGSVSVCPCMQIDVRIYGMLICFAEVIDCLEEKEKKTSSRGGVVLELRI